jgi:phosphatidate phosphatase PAH1
VTATTPETEIATIETNTNETATTPETEIATIETNTNETVTTPETEIATKTNTNKTATTPETEIATIETNTNETATRLETEIATTKTSKNETEAFHKTTQKFGEKNNKNEKVFLIIITCKSYLLFILLKFCNYFFYLT